MRRRDCVRNLDTPLVCAKRHRHMTIKCAYPNVELQCSVLSLRIALVIKNDKSVYIAQVKHILNFHTIVGNYT